MASYYVDSNAAGAADGTSWADAYTTLAAAASGKAAGDSFFVAHNHAETQATAITITFPGTVAAPNLIYCVNKAGSVPPVAADLATTATVTTTNNAAGITCNGTFYMYGINWHVGGGASQAVFNCSASASASPVFDNCTWQADGTGGFILQSGTTSSVGVTHWKNCTFTFPSTANSMATWRPVEYYNCTFAGAAVPNVLFFSTNTQHGHYIKLVGCDLSAFGVGKTLFAPTGNVPVVIQMRDCKLGASVTVAGTPAVPGDCEVDLINCDSGDTNYRNESYRYEGTFTTETTIVRTGGASDGTTPVAWKIVTTANSEIPRPFVSMPIAIWNETVGSAVTAKVHGTWGGGAVPNNDEIWIEAQYLGTSGFPISSRVNNGVATPLHAPAAQGAEAGETWGGGTTDFSMSVTFTPQEKGWIYVTVHAALPSTTFYVDPKVTLS